VQSKQAFNSLREDVPVSFFLHHWIKEALPIIEPEYYDFNYLIDSIVESFESKNLSVRLVPTKRNEVLHVFIDDKNLRFRLPKKLDELMRLPDSFEFSLERQDIFLPSDLPSINDPPVPDPVPTPPNIEIGKRNQLYITTNIVENQHVSSNYIPLLRLVSRKNTTNEECYFKFWPVYFLPLKSSEISQIQIQLIDEDFKLLSESATPTTVILHFRSKH